MSRAIESIHLKNPILCSCAEEGLGAEVSQKTMDGASQRVPTCESALRH